MMAGPSVPTILKERKYPFIFAFFLLLIFVTLLIISNSQSPFPIPTSTTPLSSSAVFPPPANHSSSTAVPPPANGYSPTPAAAAGAPPTAGDDNRVIDDVGWRLCKGEAVDYIPCLDNWKAIKELHSRRRKEHRERHCPNPPPRCLVPLPVGYRIPVAWPKSRDMIWYNNVPHPKLVEYKKDQRWVVKYGRYFVFPGGGTQFKNGAKYYIESIEKMLPAIEIGKRTRVVLDVGCGVASFGGALLDKNVMTMSFAPKDEHEAQIQFALERGIPAMLSVIGTQKLAFPDNSYDAVHCARCRVHWDGDGGRPLMELNRILRPGGYFIWSATPVYKKDEQHKNTWNSMIALTKSFCWKEVAKMSSGYTGIGIVIFQKPTTSSCYKNRRGNNPPLCDPLIRPNGSWYVPLDSCLMPLSNEPYKWPSPWPQRLNDKPQIISKPDDEESYKRDSSHWSALVSDVYVRGLNINWSNVRNVMDMNAGYGGFASALVNLPLLWVMNVVPIHEPDTLSVIYDRGLLGVYHDWCESFNTYPRTYDLLHSSFLLGNLSKRCDIVEVAAEIDRVLRPGGHLLVRDTAEILNKIAPVLKSLHWTVNLHQDQFLVGEKGFWRPGK